MTSPQTAPDLRLGTARKIVAVALVLTALAYISTLQFNFVNDDQPQIVENTMLHSWHAAPRFFIHHLWWRVAPQGHGNFYRPLFLLWFLINFQVFHLHPMGWHATTLAMHLLVTWLVYRLARRVLHDDISGAVAALIFGLHPTHVETVAWVSGVSDSLLAAPLIGAVLCWANFREPSEGRRWGWLAASIGLGATALMTKETAVILPVVIAAYEAWVVSATRPAIERVRYGFGASLPFIALDVWYLAIRKIVLSGFAFSITQVGLSTMLLTWPSLLWFYLRHLVWPVGLALFYETPYVTAPGLKNFWAPLLGVVAVAALLAWWARRTRAGVVPFACALLVLPILPVLELRAFQYAEIAHDRYLYLPTIGLAILVASAVVRLRPARGPELLGLPAPVAGVVLAIVACFGVATATQSVYWATEPLLYSRAVAISPGNIHGVQPLAMEMVRRKDYASAVPLLEQATRLVPADWSHYFFLGFCFYNLHRYDEAERAFAQAIALDPNSAAEHYFLGLSRVETNRMAEAEPQLRRAIELLPTGRGFHEAMAKVLESRDDRQGARAELQIELRNDPQNESARASLARLEEGTPTAASQRHRGQ